MTRPVGMRELERDANADRDDAHTRAPPTQAALLALQSSAGNAAVARLLTAHTARVSRFNIDDAVEAGRDVLRAGFGLVRGLLTPVEIGGAVGRGGENAPGDVVAVRRRLVLLGYPPTLSATGPAPSAPAPDTDASRNAELEALASAIERFQAERVGLRRPDGRVDPGGRTLRALNGFDVGDESDPARATPAGPAGPVTPGGEPGGPGSAGPGTGGAGSDTAAELDPVRDAIMERAREADWPAHAQIYNRYAGAGLGIEGLASDWDGFLGQMREMNWMGHRVVGHEAFLTRLHRAQTYLRARHPDVPERELVPSINQPGSRSQWRAGERGTSYHVFGMALDIAAGSNPWISNPEYARRSAVYHWAIWRAVWLAGDGAEPVWPARSAELARTASTQQLWEHYSQASAAVGRYFRLTGSPSALAQRVQALGSPPPRPPYPYTPDAFPPDVLAGNDAGQWQRVIASDSDAWPGEHDERGFMNLRLELVEALRDEADLSWGGCDLGGEQSGDFMHFDLRTREFERMRGEIRRAA